MKLTKQQDALATRLRDAGIPGDFAVLVASRADYFVMGAIDWAPYDCVLFVEQVEGIGFWDLFAIAWKHECRARGIK